MYCKNCGSEIDPNAAYCVKCGYAKGEGKNYCQNCGQPIDPNAVACPKCGYAATPVQPATAAKEGKSKLAAGLLGIFLGGWGIHNFYLGFTGKAIAQIIVTIVTCGIGALWGFIEGIMILAGSIKQDAQGNPLQD